MSGTATLEVFLAAGQRLRRVGILARDERAHVRFLVDQSYIELGSSRPLLSVSWHVPGDEAKTRARLHAIEDKLARFGHLPPWFANLLPEGALRELVERGMPSGRASDFDVIARLGRDLPGAVVVTGGEEVEPVPLEASAASIPAGRLRFSLAGVQLKFSSLRRGERLTLPARGESGDTIIKLPNARWPDLPEVEYASMRLAAAAGVETARCELLPSTAAEDVPARLRPGPSILVVDRFDRTPEGRVHMEDFAQVLGAVGEQKYTRGNEETVLNIVHRFAGGKRLALAEALRRMTVNVLLGNSDAHLKNWSLLLPAQGGIGLSPAYDILAIHLLEPADERMALKLRGSTDPRRRDLDRFRSVAGLLKVDEKLIVRTVTGTVRQAAETWSRLAGDLPLTLGQVEAMDRWWRSLPLTEGVGSPFARERRGQPTTPPAPAAAPPPGP